MAVDLTTMIADGGAAISHLAVLRDQPALFGRVASTATAWRVLAGIDDRRLAPKRTNVTVLRPGLSGRVEPATMRGAASSCCGPGTQGEA